MQQYCVHLYITVLGCASILKVLKNVLNLQKYVVSSEYSFFKFHLVFNTNKFQVFLFLCKMVVNQKEGHNQHHQFHSRQSAICLKHVISLK